jgi:hypothetical protein
MTSGPNRVGSIDPDDLAEGVRHRRLHSDAEDIEFE